MDMPRHIMLVEDDEDIRELISLSLAKIGGFKITSCDTGAAALAALNSIAPDLLLLDVMMPGIDGRAIFKLLKQNHAAKNVPVIFITAKAQPKDREEYARLGAIGTIAKPFDMATLSTEIMKLWRKKRPVS